jgi:mRNA-degrading endonuclease RelE of RelBE toxin-antitoxin system
MKLCVSLAAQEEVLEAACEYELRKIGLGDKFLAAVEHGLEKVKDSPLLFPSFDFKPRGHRLRWYLLRRFPYLLIYDVISDDDCVVLAVSLKSRGPGYWRHRIEGLGDS